MPDALRLTLADEAATEILGRALGRLVAESPGSALTIWLRGNLGAGKTTLTRGLLRELGHLGRVPSPTYTLVEPYDLDRGRVYHVDLYRLLDPEEAIYLGLPELPGPGDLLIVEWPERGGRLVAAADITVDLAVADSGRLALLDAGSAPGQAIVAALADNNGSDYL